MMSESLPSSPINCPPALEDAWRQFGDYDKNANLAQKRFIQQRKWIIALGVIVTTLAVFDIVLEKSLNTPNHWFANLLLQITTALSLDYETITSTMERGLSFVIILIPIFISILVAGSVKFNMGVNWVMLRSGAESIKREIYRYRTQVDVYSSDPNKNPEIAKGETRDVTLARKTKQISKRVMETQVNMSELEVYDYKREGLPPVYGVAPADDGFSNMTAEQYIHWRIEDQFDYYRRKAKRLAQELQRFQWSIYILGGLGTLMAAIELEIWVAVTSALVTALSSFLEFKRVETNLIACNMAAADLYDIRTWWRALPETAKQQQANKETLVKSAEAVIQGENASWLTEMREALSEIYGDQEQEEDVGDRSTIAVLPQNVTTESDSASSASGASSSILKGEGGEQRSSMRATLFSNQPGSGSSSAGTPTPDRSGDSPDGESANDEAPSSSYGWPQPDWSEAPNKAPGDRSDRAIATRGDAPDFSEDWLNTPTTLDESLTELDEDDVTVEDPLVGTLEPTPPAVASVPVAPVGEIRPTDLPIDLFMDLPEGYEDDLKALGDIDAELDADVRSEFESTLDSEMTAAADSITDISPDVDTEDINTADINTADIDTDSDIDATDESVDASDTFVTPDISAAEYSAIYGAIPAPYSRDRDEGSDEASGYELNSRVPEPFQREPGDNPGEEPGSHGEIEMHERI